MPGNSSEVPLSVEDPTLLQQAARKRAEDAYQQRQALIAEYVKKVENGTLTPEAAASALHAQPDVRIAVFRELSIRSGVAQAAYSQVLEHLKEARRDTGWISSLARLFSYR